MGKKLKKEELLLYSYSIFYNSWPHTTKKLGLLEDSLSQPDIDFIKKISEYDSNLGGILKIDYSVVSKAFNNKILDFKGLEIKYEDCLEYTIIHESVHHIQNFFYDIECGEYNCITEGLADLVSLEIMLEKKKYDLIAWEVVDYFIEMKKKYKDYLGLPEKYNKCIEDIIKGGSYKPDKRDIYYAKGFLYICEKHGKMNNYLELLINPFKDSEMD